MYLLFGGARSALKQTMHQLSTTRFTARMLTSLQVPGTQVRAEENKKNSSAHRGAIGGDTGFIMYVRVAFLLDTIVGPPVAAHTQKRRMRGVEATLAKFAVASLVSVAVGFSAPCSLHPSTHHGKGIKVAYVAVVYTAATHCRCLRAVLTQVGRVRS